MKGMTNIRKKGRLKDKISKNAPFQLSFIRNGPFYLWLQPGGYDHELGFFQFIL